MRKLLIFTASLEMVTGMVFLAFSPTVVRLLFTGETSEAAIVMCRIAGICLIAFGLACWPEGNMRRAFYGMTTYGTLVALYGVVLGLYGHVGSPVWPLVALHGSLSVLLVWTWRRSRATAQVP